MTINAWLPACKTLCLPSRPDAAALIRSPRVTIPTNAPFAAYAGDYELFPGLILTVSTDGRGLFIAPLGGERGELPALSPNSFMLNPRQDISIEFPRVVGGSLSSLCSSATRKDA